MILGSKGILPIILSFSGGNVADSYHDNPPFSVHLSNNIAWSEPECKLAFFKNPGYDTLFWGRDTYLQNDILGIDKSILVCYNRLMGATITVGG